MSLLQASQPDELTIDEQEMLEVIEDGDMEDWVKVHKHTYIWALCAELCAFAVFDFTALYGFLCVFSRLAIRQAKWATSQRNTCSSRPPTVC